MTQDHKKQSEKPTVAAVALVPEEAVLGGCKIPVGGPFGANSSECTLAARSVSSPCHSRILS